MFHVVVPAWGERCVRVAAGHVIPSIRAALRGVDGRLIVYTDTPSAFEGVSEVRSVGPNPGDTHLARLQGTLRNLHRWTMAEAPPGFVAVLLNADTVISSEFFQFCRGAVSEGAKVIVGAPMRTVIKDEPPPVGVPARVLLDWAWRNRHPIIEDCVWGRGRTKFQNTVVLEQGSAVVLHSVHLHPVAVVNDGREPKFRGTIDDDFLVNYADNEIRYIRDAEVGFAELSPPELMQGQYESGERLTVHSVVSFGRKCHWNAAHVRNLRQPIRIRGHEPVDSSCVKQIADAFTGRVR
jgi:hypothetical protein